MERITEKLSLNKVMAVEPNKVSAPIKNKYPIVEYMKKDTKHIHIEFEKYFGEEAKNFNDFTVTLIQKKAYGNNIPLICEENNRILSRNQTIAEKYIYTSYAIKKAIDTGIYNDNHEYFIGDIVTQILTPDLIAEVESYVEDNYIFDVDSSIEIEKFDPGTTFMNRHFKIIYSIANLCRLVIPLSTQYVYMSHKMDPRKFFYDVFMNIWRIMQAKSNVNVYSKLHTQVQRFVQKTKKVDNGMWEQLTIFNQTPESSVEDAMKRIITDIIFKLVFDKKPMNLIITVIKYFTSWTFRKEHPFKIHQLSDSDGQGSDDDSIISEADVFDSYNVKRDESVLLIRNFFTEDTIRKIIGRYEITFEPGELDFYFNTPRRIHDLQKFCVLQAFSKPFGGSSNIYGCNRKEFIVLLVSLSKIMHRMGIHHLPDFLIAERTVYNYRRISKSFEDQITNHPTYKILVNNKYENISNVFTRKEKDFIRSQIVMVVNNDYSYLNFNNESNGKIIEKNEELLLENVLNFFNLMVV